MVYNEVMITESLKDRRINNAETACREQKQIGLRISGLVCFLNYVKCMTVKNTLERQLINYECILCR